MPAEHLTPDQILAAWERAKVSAPVPWKTSDDVILNVLAGSDPNYKYRDQLPTLKLAPAVNPEVCELAAILTDPTSKHSINLSKVADEVARVIGTKPVSRDEWVRMVGDASNVLAVVFDPMGDQRYVAATKRFMHAPVKVCLGAVPIIWMRFGYSLLDLGYKPRLLPIRARLLGSASVSDHQVIQQQGSTPTARLAGTVERILQDYGFLSTAEVIDE